MVREKMKAKRTRFSSEKVESRQAEDFIQCLEDEENNSEEEFMDLYEEQSKEHTSEVVNALHSMMDDEDISDITGQVDEIKDHSHGSQISVDPDEEMAQCVPELVISSPLRVQSTEISKTKGSQRPKFKVTPKRNEMSKLEPEKKKGLKKKALKLSKATETGIKKPKKSKTCDCDESSTKTKNKEGSWVQCSRNDCLKWRKLPNDIEPTAMPDRWVCAMNPDPSRMECTASQETCDSERDYDVVYTPFVEGSLVWAKVPGYPWWPGMVEDDPDHNCCYETGESDVNPINYHVSFVFDKDVSRSWVSYLSIRNFSRTENPNETNSKPKKQSKSLLNAITKARSVMGLPMKERLKKFSFQVLYKGPIHARATVEEDYTMDSNSDSQPSVPSQGSISFTVKKKVNKDKVKKTKKLKSSKEDGKKAKHASKVDKGRVEVVNTSESHCGNAECEDVEKKVKSKKNRKRVMVSSEDEDGEQKGESNTETVTNTTSTNRTVDEKRDDELNEEKLENKQSEKKEDSSEEKLKSVEAKTTECESQLVEDVQQMNVEGAVEHDTSGKNNTTLVKMDGNKKKIEGKQTKKLKTMKKGQENGSVAGKVLKKEGGVSPQKKKRKPKKTEEEKNGQEKANSDDLKNIQTEKKKPQKVKAGIGEKGKKIQRKKKMVDGGVKSTDTSISDEVHKNSSEQGDLTAIPEEKHTSEDLVDKSAGEVQSVDEEVMKMEEVMTMEQVALPAKETSESGINSIKKKGKKIKKSNCTISANKNNKIKCKEGNSAMNTEAMAPQPTPRVISIENSDVISKKDIKTAPKPTHKKTKTAFGKFKAPVKSSQNTMTVKASQPTNSKMANKKTNKEKSLKKHTSGMTSSLDKLPDNLECYVSIETLEKDISNLYQQLAENETTAGFLQCTTESKLRDGSNCVTVEFLDQEITLNTERNTVPSRRSVTDSPEY